MTPKISKPSKRATATTEPPMTSHNPIVIDDEPRPKRSKPTPAKPAKPAPAPISRPNIRQPQENGPEFTGTLLYIMAGENDHKREFTILKSAICQSSSYFKTEVSNYEVSNHKVPGEHLYLELGQNPDIFHIYIKWIYTGRLFVSDPTSKPASDPEPISDLANPFARENNEWARWKLCYELGRDLRDPDFMDTLIDAAIEKLRAEADTVREVARYMPEIIYHNTDPGSPARSLAVDLFLRKCKQGEIETVRNEIKLPDFIGDLLVAAGKQFLNKALQPDPLILSSADECVYYHEHHKHGMPCYKARKTYWF